MVGGIVQILQLVSLNRSLTSRLSGKVVEYGSQDYGQSALRPRLRLRLSTARPSFVAMRERNPCLRARTKRLG